MIFPPGKRFTITFGRWAKAGVWEQINDALRRAVRVAEGKQPEPTAGIVDSQSVKTTEKGGYMGTMAAKKINGRKRHLLIDTLGTTLGGRGTFAAIQDR